MNRKEFDAWLLNPDRRPLVMGVLNVTPDSFSDGGQYTSVESAVAHAEQMAAEGADLIDIGGESTRPGSDPVDEPEQIRRVVPVLQALSGKDLPVVYSIDTTRSAVAEAALDAGAYIINDISAGSDDPQMLPLAARRRSPVILMHMLGRPKTMQVNPTYQDVTAEVSGYLNERIIAAGICGIEPEKILIDPGIGFGKTVEHNLELLRRLQELTVLGRPVVVGTSRKSFIGRITGESEPSRRLFGTAATVAWCVANGAAIVRVHDVGPMVQVVKMIRAILE
ncbi:dihydropteroate synthase [Fontivita pretiosa]|uniref:dihydropteroate synthase n=1 Tax=Fontivita pretiosa TaxID=2989684 RepID=UPI003D175FCB